MIIVSNILDKEIDIPLSKSNYFINLSNNIFVKRIVSTSKSMEAYLYDSVTGKNYCLNNNQYEAIKLFNGSKKLDYIFTKYNDTSFLNFLNSLEKLHFINYSNYPSKRNIIKVIKYPQLKILHVEVTNKCNLHCKHCYQKDYMYGKNDLLQDKIYDIINAVSSNIDNINISGGEPFIRKDILNILNYIESKNIHITNIFTNGLLLNNGILKSLKKLNSKITLVISLDGISHNSFKLRGFYSKRVADKKLKILLNNIKLAKDFGFYIRVNTLLNSYNINELTNIYDTLKDLEINEWKISFPKNIGSYICNSKELDVDTNYAFKQCFELIKLYLYDINNKRDTVDITIQNMFHKSFLNKLNYHNSSCFICDYNYNTNMCCIKPNGDVTPCTTMINRVVGNIHKNNILNIWHSKDMQKIKRIRLKKTECKRCKFLKMCGGGCKGNSDIFYKSLTRKDPIACKTMKYFHQKIFPYIKSLNMTSN